MMGLSRPVLRRIQGVMFKLPLMITCEAFEDFIIAYLDDELTPKQKFVFEMHLKVCRECRDYLHAYRASIEAARLTASAPPPVLPDQVPDDLVKAVLDARDA
jgi:anti-sigma factor RsiW